MNQSDEAISAAIRATFFAELGLGARLRLTSEAYERKTRNENEEEVGGAVLRELRMYKRPLNVEAVRRGIVGGLEAQKKSFVDLKSIAAKSSIIFRSHFQSPRLKESDHCA